MNKFTTLAVIISIITLVLCLKIVRHKIWFASESRPYHLKSIEAKTPEEHILFGQKIDINTATKDSLTVLSGIGPKLAGRIIKFREIHGGFSSVDELEKVRGLGPKKLARIRPWITAGYQ